MKRAWILGLISALALIGRLAVAEDAAKPADGKPGDGGPQGDRPPRPPPGEMFKKLDTDSSGKVSLAEFKAGPRAQKDPAKAEEYFKKMDKDASGDLTLEELMAGRPPRGPKDGKDGHGKPGAPGEDHPPKGDK